VHLSTEAALPKRARDARVRRVDDCERMRMAIDPELLKILVCPECKTPVEPTADQKGLRCATCRRVYPIQDGIPVMLVDEARREP